MSKAFIFFAALALILLVSCTGYKIETFYIGQGNMQFFIPPFEMEGDQNDAFLDFTCRSGDIPNSDVILNFSVFFDEDNAINEIQSASIIIDNKKHYVDSLQRLYVDFVDNKIRYTCRITRTTFIEFFESEAPGFAVVAADQEIVFVAGSDYEEARQLIRKQILPQLKN
jgi:hypothetical protein